MEVDAEGASSYAPPVEVDVRNGQLGPAAATMDAAGVWGRVEGYVPHVGKSLEDQGSRG